MLQAGKRERAAACIRLRNARQHNLKGFDLDLPLGRLIVVTGLSGSGKSSLAFDTLYAEGQRRYVETFSSYARQFLDRMDRPAVDRVEGIPPAIAIEQRNTVRTSRSTVGTMTEVTDYLKLLMPRAAQLVCDGCRRPVRLDTPASAWSDLTTSIPERTPILVTFEVAFSEKVGMEEALEGLRKQGYLRVWDTGEVRHLDEVGKEGRRRRGAQSGRIEVVQDRLVLEPEARARFVEAAEAAFRLGRGTMAVRIADRVGGGSHEAAPHRFSSGWHCPHCDRAFPRPVPGLFSFNHPLGACPTCRGFGRTIEIDYDLVIPDRELSLAQGAIRPWTTPTYSECNRELLAFCRRRRIPIHEPFAALAPAARQLVLDGGMGFYGVKGFFDWLEGRTYKMHVRVFLSRYRGYHSCRACGGTRLAPAARLFQLGGKSLPEIYALPIRESHRFLSELPLPEHDEAALLLQGEIARRLAYLVHVGLGYLTLDRAARTLSGGEIQRVNLTTCLGTSLVNTLFVMDEPSVGMHPADLHRLAAVMARLRDQGNTLLVVEHDESIIRQADHVVDLGPGRGTAGGEVVFQGRPEALRRCSGSITGRYLRGDCSIPVPARRRPVDPARVIRVIGARAHNLKGIDVEFPLGLFTCVTGVSGSGKSTLVEETLWRALRRQLGGAEPEAGLCTRIEGADLVGAVTLVDQSPIGRTPRSNAALYLEFYDPIRACFAATDEAIRQGLDRTAFSFNTGRGRCPRCGGAGHEKIEMQFLSDVFVTCPECEGRRFQPDVLRVRYRDRSLDQVLAMTAAEARDFFGDIPAVTEPLRLMCEVGLDYLPLGQPLNTLSGGEAQRLKLLAHLRSSTNRPGLFILDEPTTGLHLEDVRLLLDLFRRLVDEGHTLIVVEHHLDVIKSADHIIDLGPGAGDEGGTVVAKGTPEAVAAHPDSLTGRHLRSKLAGAAAGARPGAAAAPEAGAGAWTLPARRGGNGAAASIRIVGAREHNLRDLTVALPRNRFVVVTGVSGSGKSSLAFDILFAEGQRRFLDSMSAYVRQYVQQMARADVDLVEGIPPSVAIEQRVTRGGRKSTVGTVTEILQYLRLLYAKLGRQHCPDCGVPVSELSRAELFRRVDHERARGPVTLFAPLVRGRKGIYRDLAGWAAKRGYARLRVDGATVPTDPPPSLDRYREHDIDLELGLLDAGGAAESRRLIEEALALGNGTIITRGASGRERIHSRTRSCPRCARAFEELDPLQFSFNSPRGWCPRCRGYGATFPQMRDDEEGVDDETPGEGEAVTCVICRGGRLRREAEHVLVGDRSLPDVSALPIDALGPFLSRIAGRGTARERAIAGPILAEVNERLRFLGQVGLSYLALDRSADTLSGGETQRIRLAAQLGSNLRGVLYVLDEPTIGLHPRDNLRLLEILRTLEERGNSLVVVEHDEETMRQADIIVDLGPGPGEEGGRLVVQGTLQKVMRCRASATGRALREPMSHPIRGARRSLADAAWLEVRGARLHNLKEVDAAIPLGRFTAVTGVSGSGKSTLVRGVLKAQLERLMAGARRDPALCAEISGWRGIDALYEVDQTPVGKTPRSTPATYTKVFDTIRGLFAQTPLARMRGYSPSRFSFNTAEGSCPECQGQGMLRLEMSFLPEMSVLCEACRGRRYGVETQEVLLHERSIADVLEMTVAEAARFFQFHPAVQRPLALLEQTGLGYLRLGQPTPTLSGGEAQRLKLVRELARSTRDHILFLLEEPTIGLHLQDVRTLVEVLHQLVDRGHTVLVVEHNMELAAEADYLIDLGPEGGDAGGRIVAQGTPEAIARRKRSHTASFLADVLARPRSSRRAAG